ncbi:FAD-dependent oxidoreductase [Streptomyces xiamenensis]|uniref:FAD-dependent oxidoreductase n=1 Tax=Streptomyces xiamenensis TaxID=408015 RepID=UPI0035DEDAB2
MRVVVIGGGVIGLTTAVLLAESGTVTDIRVWSRDRAEHTTSATAGAMWEPYKAHPQHLVNAWAQETFDVLQALSGQENTGIRMVGGIKVGRSGPPPTLWWRSITPVTPVPPTDLPHGFAWGLHATLPLVNMPLYLQYLLRRLADHDVTVEHRMVEHLTDASPADLIINATGLGARELAPDHEVIPVQGQLVIVENPGIHHWLVEATGGAAEGFYAFPRADGTLILGGTAHANRWSTVPDADTTQRILERGSEVFPQLHAARVIESRVGLRPYRPQVRLERQLLADGRPCIHCYGHGGSGVTVSWASAAAVLRLLHG